MKHTLSLLLIISLMFSCKSLPHSSPKTPLLADDLPTSIAYSNGFKLFWLDLQVESKKYTSWEKFNPSQAFVKKHQLLPDASGYAFRAYVQTTNPIPLDQLAQQGISATLITDKEQPTYTMLIPLKAISSLLNNSAVKHIEKGLPLMVK